MPVVVVVDHDVLCGVLTIFSDCMSKGQRSLHPNNVDTIVDFWKWMCLNSNLHCYHQWFHEWCVSNHFEWSFAIVCCMWSPAPFQFVLTSGLSCGNCNCNFHHCDVQTYTNHICDHLCEHAHDSMGLQVDSHHQTHLNTTQWLTWFQSHACR